MGRDRLRPAKATGARLRNVAGVAMIATMHRRHLLAALALPFAPVIRAQPQTQSAAALPAAASASTPYARLQGGVPHHLTPEQEAQRVVDSPAPAGPPGRWTARAALPIPRSEMAWATVARGPHAHRRRLWRGRGQPRLPPHLRPGRRTAGSTARRCRAAPTTSRWRRTTRASRPSAASSSRTAAPTRSPTSTTSPANRWTAIAPLPRPRGAAAAVRARRPDPPDRRRLRAGGRTRQRRLARGLRPARPTAGARARRCPARATTSAASPTTARST